MARPRVMPITLSGLYNVQRVDRMIETLTPLLECEKRREVAFDFGGLVGVSPVALALLTAVVKDADDRGVLGHDSTVVWPRSPAVRNYLLRMDFLKVVLGDAYEQVTEPFKRKAASGFRPCSEFLTPEQSQEVARDLAQALAESCKTEKVARLAIHICLGELTENVLHHADAPSGGFAAAQTWPKHARLEIAIVDLGIGVRSSLMKNPTYADIPDDASAIETALNAYVTSNPDRNLGIGLFITKMLLRDNGGVLLVRSGKGAVYAGAQEARFDGGVAFPGTLVTLTARTDRRLDINRVYRMLNDADSGDNDA